MLIDKYIKYQYKVWMTSRIKFYHVMIDSQPIWKGEESCSFFCVFVPCINVGEGWAIEFMQTSFIWWQGVYFVDIRRVELRINFIVFAYVCVFLICFAFSSVNHFRGICREDAFKNDVFPTTKDKGWIACRINRLSAEGPSCSLNDVIAKVIGAMRIVGLS